MFRHHDAISKWKKANSYIFFSTIHVYFAWNHGLLWKLIYFKPQVTVVAVIVVIKDKSRKSILSNHLHWSYSHSNMRSIAEYASFETSNDVEWQIKCHIDWNSKNVLYFLKCTACKSTTYTGKTNNLRLRMNWLKSSATLGNSTDVIDKHVHKCSNRLKYTLEPKFHIYAFLE